MSNERERLIAAMDAADPITAVVELARTLRDEGMAQLPLYRLLEAQAEPLSGDDPRLDAILDTLDLVVSGPWAKGRGLFAEELTNERLREE